MVEALECLPCCSSYGMARRPIDLTRPVVRPDCSPKLLIWHMSQHNQSHLAPSYLPIHQELQLDSESEEGYASIAMFQLRPPLQIDYWALNAHCSKDTLKDYWTKAQPVNGVEVRTSALASMCLADNDLAGSQLCHGTPTSHPRDWMMTNPLPIHRYPSTYPDLSIYLSRDIYLISSDIHLPIQRYPSTYPAISSHLSCWIIDPVSAGLVGRCVQLMCCNYASNCAVYLLLQERAPSARRPRRWAGWARQWGSLAGWAPAAGPPGR